MPSILFPVMAVNLALALASPAVGMFAQGDVPGTAGIVEGAVVDPTKAVRPGAKVALRDEQTASVQVLTTDDQGRFRASLAPGRYRLTVSLAGFETLLHESVTVEAGRTVTLSLSLQLSAYREDIAVTAALQAGRSQSTTALSREAMEGRHAVNVNDFLLAGVPGVSTARRSNYGFSGPGAGFYLRGLTGTRVTVFVDGVPNQVNNHFHPRSDQYSPDMIDRLEITRGPSAVLHGASAVGGVLDVVTRSPKKGFSGWILGQAGELDTREASGDAGYGWTKGHALFSFQRRKTDAQVLGEEFDLRNLNLKLRQELGGKWAVGLRVSNTKEFPGDGTSPNPNLVLFRFTEDLTSAVLTFDHEAEKSKTLFAARFNTLDTGSFRFSGARGRFQDVDRRENEYGALLKHTWRRGSGDSVTAGAEVVRFSDRRTNAAGTAPKVENTEGYVSGYGHLDQALGSRTRLQAGARFTQSGQFGTDLSPEIGIIQEIGGTWAARVRGGKAFRVPRVDEVNAPFAAPNEDLEPEKFWHAEAGLGKRFSNRAWFDVAFWWMDGDNLIRTVGSGAAARSVNVGSFNHRGIEASLHVRILDGLNVLLGGAVLDTDATPSVPQRTLDVGLDFRRAKFRATVISRLAAKNTTPALEDYFVTNLRASYDVVRGLSLVLDVDNLTDEEYATLTGPAGPILQVPRTVLGGVRYGWGSR